MKRFHRSCFELKIRSSKRNRRRKYYTTQCHFCSLIKSKPRFRNVFFQLFVELLNTCFLFRERRHLVLMIHLTFNLLLLSFQNLFKNHVALNKTPYQLLALDKDKHQHALLLAWLSISCQAGSNDWSLRLKKYSSARLTVSFAVSS